jgi:glycosyltransferase involved in cell wall biosynthesis
MSPQLLEAVAKLPENYVAVFTGMKDASSECGECYERAKSLGIERRVISKPFLSYGELLEYTANADVGILLYPNDGIGNFYQCPGRLSECAACGLPFVTSHFPGLQNLLFRYPIGRTCDPYSPAEIAEAIQTLAEVSPSEAELRRRQIRKTFREHLAYEHGAGALIARVRAALDQIGS